MFSFSQETLLAAPSKEELIVMKQQRKVELAAQAKHLIQQNNRTMLSPPAMSAMPRHYDPNDPLLHVTASEKRARSQRVQALGSRHSRFGGTLAVIRGGSSSTTKHSSSGTSTPLSKEFVWAHNLADPHQKQRRNNGGVIRGSNGITRSMNIARGSRLAQTRTDTAAVRAGATDGSVRPSALTVGFGLGSASTVNTAAKSQEVRASLKALMEEFLKTGKTFGVVVFSPLVNATCSFCTSCTSCTSC